MSSIFGENGGMSNYREFPLKGQNVLDKKDVFFEHGGKRSIAGMALHPISISMKESPF